MGCVQFDSAVCTLFARLYGSQYGEGVQQRYCVFLMQWHFSFQGSKMNLLSGSSKETLTTK